MTRITRKGRRGWHAGAYRGRRPRGVGLGATTRWAGSTGAGAADSLERLEHLTHLARQVLDLLETGEGLLVELLGREEQDLRFSEDR